MYQSIPFIEISKSTCHMHTFILCISFFGVRTVDIGNELHIPDAFANTRHTQNYKKLFRASFKIWEKCSIEWECSSFVTHNTTSNNELQTNRWKRIPYFNILPSNILSSLSDDEVLSSFHVFFFFFILFVSIHVSVGLLTFTAVDFHILSCGNSNNDIELCILVGNWHRLENHNNAYVGFLFKFFPYYLYWLHRFHRRANKI